MRARWGAAGTGTAGTSTPTPEGSPLRVAERGTATTGIHATGRVLAPGPGHRSFLSRPAWAGPHTKKTFSVKSSPKVPAVLQALIHHTAGQCRIWKDLRHGSQAIKEPYA
ncbi:hypothetical protein GCM10018783_54420 [Streptomyces griseosporeus]|nr:hypothetical protein GCM10018783_54420 [Streptomyces griseosporeus]